MASTSGLFQSTIASDLTTCDSKYYGRMRRKKKERDGRGLKWMLTGGGNAHYKCLWTQKSNAYEPLAYQTITRVDEIATDHCNVNIVRQNFNSRVEHQRQSQNGLSKYVVSPRPPHLPRSISGVRHSAYQDESSR